MYSNCVFIDILVDLQRLVLTATQCAHVIDHHEGALTVYALIKGHLINNYIGGSHPVEVLIHNNLKLALVYRVIYAL